MPSLSKPNIGHAVGISASGVPVNVVAVDGAPPRHRRGRPAETPQPRVRPSDRGLLGSLIRSFRELGNPAPRSQRPAVRKEHDAFSSLEAGPSHASNATTSKFTAEPPQPPATGRGTPFNPFTAFSVSGWRSRWGNDAKHQNIQKGPPDGPLLALIFIMLVLGICAMQSASLVTAYTQFKDQLHFLWRQLVSAAIGIMALCTLWTFDYRTLPKFASLLAIALVIALFLISVPSLELGVRVNGAARWMSLFGMQFQPSEFIKPILVIILASSFAASKTGSRTIKYGLVPYAIIYGVVAILVMLQPDLGTTIVIVATGACVYLVAGAPWIVFSVVGALGVGMVALLTWIEPYRMARFTTFLAPFNDPQKDGYHVVQSLLALGSGGLTGVGFGMGRQKFLFLPYPNTDSIFAVIGEEFGLMGTLITLTMFAGFLYRGMVIAGRAPDALGRYIATGLTVGIALQGFLNMAVMTSSVPFTGITLPFFSYGGSSLVTTLASCGVLLSISAHSGHSVPTSGTVVGWWRRSVAATRESR